MNHVKAMTKWPDLGDDTVDLNFILATMQFAVTVLSALQTKKASEA